MFGFSGQACGMGRETAVQGIKLRSFPRRDIEVWNYDEQLRYS
jgi:hypothetical protein